MELWLEGISLRSRWPTSYSARARFVLARVVVSPYPTIIRIQCVKNACLPLAFSWSLGGFKTARNSHHECDHNTHVNTPLCYLEDMPQISSVIFLEYMKTPVPYKYSRENMSAAFLPEVPASGIGDHKGIDPTIAPGLNPSTLGVISPESSAQDLTWREHLKASLVGEYHAETIMTMEEPPPPYESHSALPIRETLPYSQPTQPLTFEIPLSLRGIPDAEGFIVRKDAMRFLEEKLLPCSGQSVATSRQVVVLYGPAGVGKTRLAAEFVRRNNTSFSSIFFLSGENKEALLQDTKAALDRIWDIWPSGSTGRPLVKPTRDSAIQAAVLKWFSIAENHKWLVIFDNVDTLPTKSFDIKDFFPSADHGKILITTRLSDLNYGRIRHNLQEMDGEQACDLLVSSIIAAKRGGGEAKVTVREGKTFLPNTHFQAEILQSIPSALPYISFLRNSTVCPWRLSKPAPLSEAPTCLCQSSLIFSSPLVRKSSLSCQLPKKRQKIHAQMSELHYNSHLTNYARQLVSDHNFTIMPQDCSFFLPNWILKISGLVCSKKAFSIPAALPGSKRRWTMNGAFFSLFECF